jgi:NADPH:quinone reductase-like Zn-dependent oxidoreductase
MRAIRIHGFGGIDTMRLDEIPRPVPGAGEMLVAVKAAGVGPWDRLVREDRSGLGQALPLTLGSDVSGTVAALGAGVGVFALGDPVYGATNDQFVGGYADYALVEAGKVAPKPAALDYVTAAGLPVVAVTAWQVLFEYARIEPGQAILVRGAAGGVGACATQMAKEAGANVYGTARARDVERVRALGAEPVVERDRIGAQLASRSLDAVIDTIGGDALESTCEALRPNGTIVSIVRAPDEAYLRSKGVRAAYFIVDVTFHCRRHARPARQNLGDVRTRNAQLADRRGSRPRRREHRPPHARWRASQARKDLAQGRRLTAAPQDGLYQTVVRP